MNSQSHAKSTRNIRTLTNSKVPGRPSSRRTVNITLFHIRIIERRQTSTIAVTWQLAAPSTPISRLYFCSLSDRCSLSSPPIFTSVLFRYSPDRLTLKDLVLTMPYNKGDGRKKCAALRTTSWPLLVGDRMDSDRCCRSQVDFSQAGHLQLETHPH